jgi:hypothetical protein
MVFWIVILLCIVAQWTATWARKMVQRRIEPLSPSALFDEIPLLNLLARLHRQYERSDGCYRYLSV